LPTASKRIEHIFNDPTIGKTGGGFFKQDI
jgi:hypothetical protein